MNNTTLSVRPAKVSVGTSLRSDMSVSMRVTQRLRRVYPSAFSLHTVWWVEMLLSEILSSLSTAVCLSSLMASVIRVSRKESYRTRFPSEPSRYAWKILQRLS